MGDISTLEWLFAATGVLLAVSGILGGGLEVRELKIPRLNPLARLLAVVFGLGFVVLAIQAPGRGIRAGSDGDEPEAPVDRPLEGSRADLDAADRKSDVTVVDVLGSGSTVSCHGFFTGKGTVILFLPRDDATHVRIAWKQGGREVRRSARILKKGGPQAPLLALAEVMGPAPADTRLPIRIAGTLDEDEPVWRYLGEDDLAPGFVIEVHAEQGDMWGTYSLLTTLITGKGDAGAPVIDADGSLVSVILGSSTDDTYTISLPIELIKLAFPEAF